MARRKTTSAAPVRRRVALAVTLLAAAAPAAAQAPRPLSLREAVALAAEAAPGVELAAVQVEEAEARADRARSPLLPSVSATATELDRTFNLHAMGIELPAGAGAEPLPARVGPFNNVDARLHLNQALFDRASHLHARAARQAVGSSAAEQQVAVDDAAQRAAQAYLRAGRARAALAARRGDLELAAELLELAETQLEAGVGTAIDVTRARTQKVAADGRVLLAQNDAEQAQIELARAVGVDPATRFALGDSLGDLRTALPTGADSAVALALARRPELRRAQTLVQAARTEKRAIRADRLPRVDLFADYGASGLRPDDVIATRQVGVQVSVPVFDGLGRASRLAEQDALLREAEVRDADLRMQIAAGVRAALLRRSSGEQQLVVAQERLSLAEAELAQARERFANGIAGNIELIQAQRSLVEARDAVIGARFAIASAGADLARALGMAAEIR